jgi:hypothetical protein
MNISIPVEDLDRAGVIRIMCGYIYLGINKKNRIGKANEKYHCSDSRVDVLRRIEARFISFDVAESILDHPVYDEKKDAVGCVANKLLGDWERYVCIWNLWLVLVHDLIACRPNERSCEM